MGSGGRALVAFAGRQVDAGIAAVVADPRVAGVTLYRSLNVESAAQTRELTRQLVAAAGRSLLIGVDQEGGQLLGAGPDATPFAGNMALGAADDPSLARRVASAIGTELRALGINVDYAPVADIATRPGNPSLGIRSFGERPERVAALTAAFVGGLQSAGVAATLKHFPGKGEAAVDPHDQLPVLELSSERLEAVEFVPFRSGIDAGARLVMVGHYALPLLTGDRGLPASASKLVLEGLIRGRLGFSGLIVTDALDMGGFTGVAPEDPLDAGADLLLYGPRQIGALPSATQPESRRVDELLRWLSSFPQPELPVVGGDRHRDLASELASRSITLVRDHTGLIPLRTGHDSRILAIMPRPKNLTPADTSELVQPDLAAAIRKRHRGTTELLVGFEPSRSDIDRATALAAEHDLVVVGTIGAGSSQSALVRAVLASGTPTVTVALRTPDDLARYQSAPAYLCTYGILAPSMEALAGALFGAPISGRLPVSIPGMYPVGHGMVRSGG